MNWPSSCAAVIPCLNEARAIGALVREVREELPTVFVVDDGSTDGTEAEAARAGARVLRHQTSLGKGLALALGWQESRRAGFEWALSLDGDGQHSPQDISGFLREAEATNARMVIGNRMGNASRMPWIRRTANRWMSRRLSRLAGRPLPDSQCGFRLIHLPTLELTRPTATHFEIESDVLIRFASAGHPIEFTPIQVIYAEERSKIHPVRDTIRWWRWWRGAREGTAKSEKDGNRPSPRPAAATRSS